ALAAQNHPAQNRYVVIGRDGRTAARTKRTRAHHGKLARQAINADVQEAAEQKTKQEKYRREKDVHADEIGMQYAPPTLTRTDYTSGIFGRIQAREDVLLAADFAFQLRHMLQRGLEAMDHCLLRI